METFDYKKFAKELKKEAIDALPSTISHARKKYILKKMEEKSGKLAQALTETYELEPDKIKVYEQIMAEWIYKKALNLANSKIHTELWDEIINEISNSIFTTIEQCYLKKKDLDSSLSLIEKKVKKTYTSSLKKLYSKNLISEEDYKLALIEDDAKNENLNSDGESENEESAGNVREEVSAILFVLSTILFVAAYFAPYIRQALSPRFMVLGVCALIIGVGLLKLIISIDIKKRMKEVEKLKDDMQDITNREKIYENMEIDILGLRVGKGLLPIADLDEDGMLLPTIAILRNDMTDDLGYVIPYIRIQDDESMHEYEYKIFVREREVASGFVYPGKCLIQMDDDIFNKIKIPKGAVIGIIPKTGKKGLWIDEIILEENECENYFEPQDIIAQHIKKIAIEYIDKILSIQDVVYYGDLYIKSIGSNERFLDMQYNIMNRLTEQIGMEGIRQIFVNLISEGISVKDAPFIFSRICHHAESTDNVDSITKKIINDFRF